MSPQPAPSISGQLGELLAPISDESPAGEDLTGTDDWLAIREARRADDTGNLGAWERERKESNWNLVRDLASSMLATSAKDLRLAVWLTEAEIHRRSWVGLRDGLELTRNLVEKFWTLGLHPRVDDGELRYRAVPLEWLGEKLSESIRLMPLTARIDSDRDYSLANYRQARQVGFEKDLIDSSGFADETRRARRQSAIASGGLTGEMFEAAIRASRRAGMERVLAELAAVESEFSALQTALEERLDNETPDLSETREVLRECRDVVENIVRAKRTEEPDPIVSREPTESEPAGAPLAAETVHPIAVAMSDGVGPEWAAAERMIQSGKLQQGLAEMTRLAAAEHGRSRFLRKLALAEICKTMHRDRLAMAILEELAAQIETLKLDEWESTDLTGRIWGLLYQYHRSAEAGTDQAGRAQVLFEKLCKLDPWQALRWEN